MPLYVDLPTTIPISGIPAAVNSNFAAIKPWVSTLQVGPDATKTITGATHGLGNSGLYVLAYDNSVPRNPIIITWTVDATTFDVVITFAVPQSNYHVVIK